MDNGRGRAQRRSEYVDAESSDADSSTNNADANASRTPSPPLSRSRRPLRESANQAREYIEDEAELPFDAIHAENLTRWKEDDICLQYAAANARLPFDVMTDLELELFADYVVDQLHANIYLFIRNSILNMWDMNPQMQLALENVFDEMPNAYRSLSYLIVKLFTFLERYGYINYGVFRTVDEMLKRKEPTRTPDQLKAQKIKVAVIGAGVAGLVAARQLRYFGFNVIVIEARNRMGGRVFTHTNEDGVVFDMGPQFVEGSTGNPLTTLLNQLPMPRKRLQFDCPVYNNDDEPFSQQYSRVIEEAFRKLTEATTLLAREGKVQEVGGKMLSVQDAFEHFIKLQEAKVALERKEYYTAIDQLADKLEIQSKSLVAAKQVMDNLSNRLQQLLDSDPTPIREDFSTIDSEAELKRVCQVKFLRYELAKTIEIFEQLQAERNDVFYTMTTVRKNEPSEKYLNGTDRRLLDFYYANLELRLGTMLKNVALHSFATPMVNNFGAYHYSIDTGLGSLLEPLSDDVNIQYRRVVTAINYDEKHDQVLVEYERNPAIAEESDTDSPSSSSTPSNVYKVDAVICAVPLGCIKKSKTNKLKVDDEENLCVPAIRFDPELSAEKREVLGAIRMGSINKVIMIFERRFWADNQFFGRINDKESARGELFLFVSTPNCPVLYVYLAGAAANLGDTFSNEDFTTKLMQILGRMFGADCPTSPKEIIVTSWHTNDLAHGSFPYIPVGRTDADYDTLAEPASVSKSGQSERPYVFFAGDYTCREYPGRLHGAFLSGLREAARVANLFLGRVDAKEHQLEYDKLGQSYIKKMKPAEEVYLSD